MKYVNSGVGTAYNSEATEFAPGCLLDSHARFIFGFCVVFCRSLVVVSPFVLVVIGFFVIYSY